MDYQSIMGYKDNSPYRKRKFLMINSPLGIIDMNNVSIPLQAIDNTGYFKILEPNSGLHQFKGNKIMEKPLFQQGGRPIYTSNPKDPRLQAYNDSLSNYLGGKAKLDYLKKNPHPSVKDWHLFVDKIDKQYHVRHFTESVSDFPIITLKDGNKEGVPIYAKPVQPVIYKKPYQDSDFQTVLKDKNGSNNRIGLNMRIEEKKDYPIVTRPKALS